MEKELDPANQLFCTLVMEITTELGMAAPVRVSCR